MQEKNGKDLPGSRGNNKNASGTNKRGDKSDNEQCSLTIVEFADYITKKSISYLHYTPDEVYNLTFNDWKIIRESIEDIVERENHNIHLQAFLNHVATATKKEGEKIVPVYKTFESFYNPNNISQPKKSQSDPYFLYLLKKQEQEALDE